MESSVSGSAFHSSCIACIDDIRMKLEHLEFEANEVELGFEKVFALVGRKFGSLIDFSNHVERPNVKEAWKRHLDYELGIAVHLCHVINDVTEITRGPIEGRHGFFYKYGMVIKKKEEMLRLKTQMDDFTQREITPFPGSSNTNHENKEEAITVIGLEVDVQVLTRHLVQETNQMIWIVGAEGIGKTTLAIKVWENVIATDYFELYIWLNITPESKLEDILLNLLKEIPVWYMLRDCAMLKNPVEVLHQIFSSFRCLVVLDGLQTHEEMEALGVNDLGKTKTSNVMKSIIIITTRNRMLALDKKRENHIIHEMRTLSDQDAWALFNAKVHVPIELETVGLKFVRKCMGSPLRILEVGDMLSRRTATEDQWLNILNYVNQNRVFVGNL